VTDTRQYDAFGLQTGSTGSNPTPFGFAGGWGYQSDETGLQLLGHRYYDPSTGRFLTRDPIKDGRNWYGYCDNNPIASTDPSGLKPKLVIIKGDRSGGVSLMDPVYSSLADAYRLNGWDVVELDEPTLVEALEALEDADAVIIYGHGSRGKAYISYTDYINRNFLKALARKRKARGKRKMFFVQIDECGVMSDPEFINAWLELAYNVSGYEGLTYDLDEKKPGKRKTWFSPQPVKSPTKAPGFHPFQDPVRKKG
jgi:RHS repeat-associated protein